MDIHHRTGKMRTATLPLPAALGLEAAGTVVALPTDPIVLADKEYQKRGFEVGSKVFIVRTPPVLVFLLVLMKKYSQWGWHGAFAEYMQGSWTFAYPLTSSVSPRLGAACSVSGSPSFNVFS